MDIDLPQGTWKDSAQNIVIKNLGFLSCELKDMHGKYHYQELSYNIKDHYINKNGYFFKISDKVKFENIPIIPKKIFQTHRSLHYMLKKFKTKKSYQSWNKFVPEFEYHFYDDSMCDDFIKNNFSADIYNAYLKCPIHVMKADLWRYCIIYHYGGIYADADTILLQHPSIFIQSGVYLVLSPESDSMHLCQWTFAAPPKSPILKSIIDLVTDRILTTEIYGEHFIHQITGPKAFTDGIELFLKSLDCTIFSNKLLYDSYQNYLIHVFPHHYFHNSIILHLFAGNDSDGWKMEKNNFLQKT